MRFISIYEDLFVPINKMFSLIINHLFEVIAKFIDNNKNNNCIIN